MILHRNLRRSSPARSRANGCSISAAGTCRSTRRRMCSTSILMRRAAARSIPTMPSASMRRAGSCTMPACRRGRSRTGSSISASARTSWRMCATRSVSCASCGGWRNAAIRDAVAPARDLRQGPLGLACRAAGTPARGRSYHHRWFVEAEGTHLRFLAKTAEVVRDPRYSLTASISAASSARRKAVSASSGRATSAPKRRSSSTPTPCGAIIGNSEPHPRPAALSATPPARNRPPARRLLAERFFGEVVMFPILP